MTDRSGHTSYRRGLHRVVIERACRREDCREVMSRLATRELMRRGGRPSERAITFARDHARKGCELFVATG